MKKAVIYARFSSYNQQEQSIEGQIRACRDYARYHDLEIVKEYCDRAKSGTNSNRPEFQKMLKESELGGFEIVLVYQYDRFAQKIEQLRSLQNGWDGNGAMAPSHATLESIGLIINALPKSVLMHCALFPANDSGVYLQGQFKKAKLSVYVQKEQMTFIAKDAERRESGQKMVVNNENAVLLSDIVAELFV